MLEIFIQAVLGAWSLFGWIVMPFFIAYWVYRLIEGESPIRLWWSFRCFMGRPKYHEATCSFCGRQSEIHI